MKKDFTPYQYSDNVDEDLQLKTTTADSGSQTEIKKETTCFCNINECDCSGNIEKINSKKQEKQCEYVLDYQDKCDCRDDDNCGCTFPNNLPQDFIQECHTVNNRSNPF